MLAGYRDYERVQVYKLNISGHPFEYLVPQLGQYNRQTMPRSNKCKNIMTIKKNRTGALSKCFRFFKIIWVILIIGKL